ncbi:unnamed protein product [Oikopleura dioica]|uniref:RING-type domain-containing protein n=1 Tax=Oikopleura dioica TaxID=34765 RepID=E4YRD4_OIKDI|nr:unnamed protein product [Oikopleura dioica]CBY41414.1 unnamed protein product [Oikopleura dioica]
MGKKKATKKVKKEPEILPEPKRRRISLDDDDIQIIDFRPGEPIELDENSPNSDQQVGRNVDDDENLDFIRDEDIPGPSHAFHFRNEDDSENKPLAQVNREFSQRRQQIMRNLQTSLTEMEDDYNQIAQLTETLYYDRQTKAKVKQEVDELAAEIALKSAQKEILDKNLEKVSKRIETNEKTLETADQRIKSFEVNYKKEEEAANNEEAGGKVGEYECPICKEICGNEQKHMVCITTCGHRFCKDCVDRILAPNEQDAGRRGGRFLRMQQRLLDDANLQRRGPRQIAAIAAVREHIGLDFREFNPPNIFPQNGPAPRENINAADYAANPFQRAPAPREGAFVIREAGNRLDEDNFWVHPRNRDPFNNQGQRRCPTCQKHFSKKHVIRLY